jgi:site-specific DNA-methyltransferase (adenine-specific)
VSNPILILGDCLVEIQRLADDSIHAVCTDPPYGLVEFSSKEVAKLRAGRGGVWRIPPTWDGCARRPLPRFTVLSQDQKKDIERFPKLRPGAHILIAGNPVLQMHVLEASKGDFTG